MWDFFFSEKKNTKSDKINYERNVLSPFFQHAFQM